MVKNNIIGGHRHGEVLLKGSAVNSFDINNNLYFGYKGAAPEFQRLSSGWTTLDLAGWRSYLGSIGGVSGGRGEPLRGPAVQGRRRSRLPPALRQPGDRCCGLGCGPSRRQGRHRQVRRSDRAEHGVRSDAIRRHRSLRAHPSQRLVTGEAARSGAHSGARLR